MILSKQKCCLLLTGVSTESLKRTSVLQTKRVFSNKKYDSYTSKCWTCAELCEAFTFLVENIYVYYGHKLCSAHSGFVFILLWEGFYV